MGYPTDRGHDFTEAGDFATLADCNP